MSKAVVFFCNLQNDSRFLCLQTVKRVLRGAIACYYSYWRWWLFWFAACRAPLSAQTSHKGPATSTQPSRPCAFDGPSEQAGINLKTFRKERTILVSVRNSNFCPFYTFKLFTIYLPSFTTGHPCTEVKLFLTLYLKLNHITANVLFNFQNLLSRRIT